MNYNQIVEWKSCCYKLPSTLWWPYQPPQCQLPWSEITVVTFEVTTASGLTGHGYTQTFGRGGKSAQAILEHVIGPELIGKSIDHPDVLWDNLQAPLAQLGTGGIGTIALSAADIALWDVASKAAGQPLFEFLGARRACIPAYGSGFDRLYSDDEFLTLFKDYVAAGMKSVKMRLGLSPVRDRQRLSLLREALGPEIRIMTDANSAWDLAEALRHLPMLEEFGVDFLEEPITPFDAEGFAELQRHTHIPIVGGENLFTIAEFARFIRRGSLQLLQPDIGRIGGVTPWMRVAALGAAFNLPVASHLGQEVSVHVLCAARNATFLEYTPAFDAIFESPLVVNSDGTITPPSTPGTGAKLRMDLIEPYLV